MIAHSKPWLTEDDIKAVEYVLRGGMIDRGSQTSRFEKEIANYVGAKFSLAQGSGTAALILALKALGIKKGDGVVLPTYSCRNVLEAVLSVDAKPQICDVNDYGVITEETVADVADGRSRAIIAVHIFGNQCDIPSLRRFNLPIVEDACQAFGLLSPDMMRAGSMGDVGVFSFHATKCLTTGEGGMVITNQDKLAEALTSFALGGDPPSGRSVSQMSDLQAALGLSQLKRFSKIVERRKELSRRFMLAACSCGLKVGISESSNMLFRFTLRGRFDFEAAVDSMEKRGISIRRGVDELSHRLIGLSDGGFPCAKYLIETTISIPFYPALTEEEVELVEAAISRMPCHLK